MYTKKIEEDFDCGIRIATRVFGGKWKCCLLDAINKGIVRPAEMNRYIDDASARVIEMQLAELLVSGAIEKITEHGYPKKTVYRLTELGKSILPILRMMDEWGSAHSQVIKERKCLLSSG